MANICLPILEHLYLGILLSLLIFWKLFLLFSRTSLLFLAHHLMPSAFMKSIANVWCILLSVYSFLLTHSHQPKRTFWSYLKNSLSFLYYLYNHHSSFWLPLTCRLLKKLFIFTVSNSSLIFSKNLLLAIFCLYSANKYNAHQCPFGKFPNQEVSTFLSTQQPSSKLMISCVLKSFLHLTSWVLQCHDFFNHWPLFSLFCWFLLIFPGTQFQSPQNSDIELFLFLLLLSTFVA